jgi:hypothetical protein
LFDTSVWRGQSVVGSPHRPLFVVAAPLPVFGWLLMGVPYPTDTLEH